MPIRTATRPAKRWVSCGLAVVLSQCSTEGWLTAIWFPAGLLWRVVLLALAGLWLIEWRYRPRAPGPALPAAIAILTTAIAVALDELVAVAGAEAMPAGLSPSVPALAASLYWIGGALGACLWQIGWAPGTPTLRSRRGDVPAKVHWLVATGIWIWLLFPAGREQADADTLRVAMAVLLAGLLPLVERITFRKSGSPWPGAALRFAWWSTFVA